MFDFFKRILQKRCLKRHSSKVNTGLTPIKNICSAIAIIDFNDAEREKCVSTFESFCKKNNLKSQTIFFDLRKKKELREDFKNRLKEKTINNTASATANASVNASATANADNTIQNTIYPNDNKNFIYKKDINCFGKIRKSKLEKLHNIDSKILDYEMFISLIDANDFSICYLAAISKAKFKLGRKQVQNNAFDIIVSNNEEEKSSLITLNNLLSFIKKIL